jgi:hypothetical protein
MLEGLQIAFNVGEESQPDPPESYYEGQSDFYTHHDGAWGVGYPGGSPAPTFAPTPAPFSRHTVAAPLKDEEAQIQALEDKIDALRSREAAQEARRAGQRHDTAGLA